MALKLENISRLYGTLIIDQLIKSGVKHFYLSPGMRNAPLIAGLVGLKEKHQLKIYVGVDERSQAFRALGAIKSLKRPVALICTSGTALANYYPAVIEAKKAKLPLIVISADRPRELNTSDANQTIDQERAFGNYTNYNLNFSVMEPLLDPKSVVTDINFAISKALFPIAGPVHINVPFREPLDHTQSPIPAETYNKVLKILERDEVNTTRPRMGLNNDLEEFKRLALVLEFMAKDRTNNLIVIGDLPYNLSEEIRDKLVALIKGLKIPFCVDVTSGLKYHFSLLDGLTPTMDHPEVFHYFKNKVPSQVFHFGGRLTSKFFYNLIKENQDDLKYYHISESFEKEDPSFSESYSLATHLGAFINYLYDHFYFNELDTKTSPPNLWQDVVATKRQIIESKPLSYPATSKIMIDSLIENKKAHGIYIGNSTVIRSFDSYISGKESAKLSVYTHRGVSGIEGFLSAAIGASENDPSKSYTLVNGDVAFIHDLNAVYLLKEVKANLTIVIVNNFGGGIFTLLPVHGDKDVLDIITSPHEHKFDRIAEFAGIKYLSANTHQELKEKYQQCLNTDGVKLLEVFIDSKVNKELYDQLKTIRLS